LARLVNTDSGTEDPEDLADMARLVADTGAALGLAAETLLDGPHPVLRFRRVGSGSARPLLLAHMDTVFGHGEAARRPFRHDGQRAYGPGVADMKGGLLLGLTVLAELPASSFATATLVVNADEETGSHDSSPVLRAAARDADRVLVLEPGRKTGAAVVARKGVGTFRIDVRGRAAHAGVEPEKGVSAVVHLARLVLAIDGWRQRRPGLTFNVGVVGGGTRANVVAEEAFAIVDVRAETAADAALAETWLKALVTPPAEVRVTGGFAMPPLEWTRVSRAFAERLATELARRGLSLPFERTGGGSDANRLADLELPILDGLGPVGGAAHSPDEYIELDSIPTRAEVLRLAMTLPLG
jgi:glutamate carboxypeptidase